MPISKIPMLNHEYYKITLNLISQDIIDKYYLMNKKICGFIYVRVVKGMYVIVQDGIITHTSLKENLLPFVYALAPITLGLWWKF